MATRSVLLLLLTLGCGASSTHAAAGSAGADEAARAIAAARACVEAEPAHYASVWGSPLDYDHADAHATSTEASSFIVSIPEASPRGLPSGLDVRVDLATGQCEKLDME
jgi:hypothetical protein